MWSAEAAKNYLYTHIFTLMHVYTHTCTYSQAHMNTSTHAYTQNSLYAHKSTNMPYRHTYVFRYTCKCANT